MWQRDVAVVIALLIGAAAVLAPRAAAHETDQFTTPAGREFADLGPFFNRWAYDLIEGGVQRTNRQIRDSIERGDDPARMRALQRPERLVESVHSALPWSVHQIEAFEWMFMSAQMRQRFPGRLVSYREIDHNIYEHAFGPFDYRVFSRWFFASTIKVYGTYMGTDKIGHFTDLGIAYYWAWHEAREHGASEEDALAAAVRIGIEGPGSEAGWLGLLANGDYANGDLAANYLGFLFYRNIAEATHIKGELRPPLVVRDGPYWRIAGHVRRDSDFFALYISDHLDEALNPGYFDESMRPALREAVQRRADAILWRYRAADGSPRPRDYFESKLAELRTYWGADYGHRGHGDQLVSIANCCFPRPDHPVVLLDAGEPFASCTLTRGQRPLTSPDSALTGVRCLLDDLSRDAVPSSSSRIMLTEEGAPNKPDSFGRTLLHDAATSGSAEQMEAFLRRGTDPNAADAYGTTPLHLACRNGHERIARMLIDGGANIGPVNLAGCTPLHEAALCGDPGIVALLLERGSSPTARDRRGRTPEDIAAARGYLPVAKLLHTAGKRGDRGR